MSYTILFTKQAKKDLEKVSVSNLKEKAFRLLSVLKENPYEPPLEKLTGKENVYSKRINVQHRLVYEIFETEKAVKVLRMWTHYGDN